MNVRSIVISIGNEILLGRTLNGNLAFLGVELSRLGIPIHRCICIKDEADEIFRALKEAWQDADVVITTGGLGPTKDDITRASLADFFGKELLFDEEVWQYIGDMFSRRGMKMPVSNRVQAMVPSGFSVLQNERGTAPGLHYCEGRKHFFALQGVPSEMKHIFSTQIAGILAEAYPEAEALVQRDLHTFNIGESALAEIVHEAELPQNLTLAWLPQTGRVDMRIYGSDLRALDEAETIIRKKAGKYIWGVDQDDPPQCLVSLLKERKLTIAIAESCTGGLLQKYLSDVAGVSEVFLGGVVSYSNEAKTSLLKVDPAIIDQYGAVSAECALAMAEGAERLFGSRVAISVTGIAGPDGGSPEKPVGTVYFGFCVAGKSFTEYKLLFGDRESIRHKAAEAAILLLYNTLKGMQGA